MNVITTASIYFERTTHPEGTKLSLTDEKAQSLISQGVARKATKMVEVAEDTLAVTETAKAPEKAAPAAQEEGNESNLGEFPAVNKDMKRDELDAIAEAEGITDLEQYETKAALVQAINEHRANPAPAAQKEGS